MAKKIAELSHKREEIKSMSFKSLKFAQQHTFEKTFQARVKHMQAIAYSTRPSQVIETQVSDAPDMVLAYSQVP